MRKEEFSSYMKRKYRQGFKSLYSSLCRKHGYSAVGHLFNGTYQTRKRKKKDPILTDLGYQEVSYIVPLGEDIDQLVYQQARENILKKGNQ